MEKFYTADEVAEMLGIAKTSVHKLCRNGEMSCIRIGSKPPEGARDTRQYRFTESDISDYMTRGRQIHEAVSHVKDPDIKEWRRSSILAAQAKQAKLLELQRRAEAGA